ncbi:MAG: T9SS type A sorting domain-containing protein [Bacteroidota bacterium]
MYKLYKLTIALLMMCTITAFGQREVLIEASADPLVPTDIFPVIMGDTTATGERVDNNTTYLLENGNVYVTTGRLVNSEDWAMQIRAVDLENTELKPIITRLPNASGSFPDIMRSNGDVHFQNLWIISGEKGPGENSDWGKIRILGTGTTVKVSDCIIEKDRGGFLQLRADSVKMYVENSIFRNGGNRRILQGNGRGIDARNFSLDTLVMRNVIVHNIIDRFFRSQGGVSPHNYIEIDNCTAFNVAGRHGFIQLGRVRQAKITDNLFVNPIMLGTSPFYTDEQTQPDNEAHKVITIDTLYDDTQLNINNNNIFWTQDVMDVWAGIDSVSMPGILSRLIMEKLGDDAADAFFQDPVELASVPMSILQYVKDVYANPADEDMFDHTVEDISVEGTALDYGNLFDFSTFDPCYDENSASATGAEFGGAVGAVFMCPELFSSTENIPQEVAGFELYPNPSKGFATFQYSIKQASQIDLSIYNLNGQLVQTLANEFHQVGDYTLEWTNQLVNGLYIAVLRTETGVQSMKLMIK